MDGKENLVDDLSRDELIKLVRMQAAMIERLEKRLDDLLKNNNEKNPTEPLEDAYSLDAEEKRKRIKQRNAKTKRKGRVSTKDKIKKAKRTEAVFPENVSPDDYEAGLNKTQCEDFGAIQA